MAKNGQDSVWQGALPVKGARYWNDFFERCETCAKGAWKRFKADPELESLVIPTDEFRPFPELPGPKITWARQDAAIIWDTVPFSVEGLYTYNHESGFRKASVMFAHEPMVETPAFCALSRTNERRLVTTMGAVLAHECVHHLQDFHRGRISYETPLLSLATRERIASDQEENRLRTVKEHGRKTRKKVAQDLAYAGYFSRREEAECNALMYAYALPRCGKKDINGLIHVELMHCSEDAATIAALYPHWKAIADRQGLPFPTGPKVRIERGVDI